METDIRNADWGSGIRIGDLDSGLGFGIGIDDLRFRLGIRFRD